MSALAARLAEAPGAVTALTAPYDVRGVFEAARRGDGVARAVVEEEARRIALHIVPLAAVTDPALVVLGGGLGANGDLLLEPVRALLADWVPYPPRVEVSRPGRGRRAHRRAVGRRRPGARQRLRQPRPPAARGASRTAPSRAPASPRSRRPTEAASFHGTGAPYTLSSDMSIQSALPALHLPARRQPAATEMPPHSSGATSASVSENVHWWPGRVLDGVLALAVLEVGRLHDDARAVRAGALAVGTRVLDAHGHRVRDLARARRPALAADVADDHGAVAEAQLRAVVLADPHALGEAEGRAEPGDGGAHVGIDEDRDDGG